jgi:hypothetical protein
LKLGESGPRPGEMTSGTKEKKFLKERESEGIDIYPFFLLNFGLSLCVLHGMDIFVGWGKKGKKKN